MGIWEGVNFTAEDVKRRLPDPAAHLKNVCSSYSAHLKNVCSSSSANLKNVCSSSSAHLKNVYSSAHGIGASAFSRARAVSPDLSPASRFFSQSYDGGSTAAAWLYRTVRVDAPQRILTIASEPDAQVRISRTAWNLLDYTLEHSTRAYTGGIPVYKILKEGLSDERFAKAGNGMDDMRRRLEYLEALVAARVAEGESGEGLKGSGASRCDHRTPGEGLSGYGASRCDHRTSGEGLKGSGASRYDHRMPGVCKPTDVIGSFMAGGFSGGNFINEQVIPKARRDFLLCNLN